jgi:hypothetical protein
MGLLFLVLIWTAVAAEVTGRWKATYPTQDGPVDAVYDFKVEGDKLTGGVTSAHGDATVVDGKVEGDTITFALERDGRRFPHKGKITGDEIKLEVTIGERTVEVTAKRVT